MARIALCGCLLAVLIAGCGSSPAEDARRAAEGYVKALGNGDAKGTCGHMTTGLQQRFRSAITFANPELSGDCPKLMQAALDALPADQLTQFGSAKIDDLRVKGSTGSFTYTLTGVRIAGKLAKEGGSWKVSCCVPGQQG